MDLLVVCFAVGLLPLAGCGRSVPPVGLIGCSCFQQTEGLCDGIDSAVGLRKELTQVCMAVIGPECTAAGGLFNPLFGCPGEDRYATCVEPPDSAGLAGIRVWMSGQWDSAGDPEIISDCTGRGGVLEFH